MFDFISKLFNKQPKPYIIPKTYDTSKPSLKPLAIKGKGKAYEVTLSYEVNKNDLLLLDLGLVISLCKVKKIKKKLNKEVAYYKCSVLLVPSRACRTCGKFYELEHMRYLCPRCESE